MKAIILLFIPLLLTSCHAEPKLLFESGFEEGVYLEEPYNFGDSSWYQDIKGSDSAFTWPIELWETTGVFQVLVDSERDASKFIRNEIVSTIGHDDQETRVLKSTIFKADEEWTQDPYILMDAKESGDLYVKYYIKFPQNLVEALGDGTNDDGWCTFFEWKTPSDYRIAVYIYIEDGVPFWYVHGDNAAKDGYDVYEEYWFEENRHVLVPNDEWFLVEYFFHRSEKSDGRFLFKVNSEVVVDYYGPNKIEESIDRIMLFTVYSEKYPLIQLVDDIEIWDGIPRKNQ